MAQLLRKDSNGRKIYQPRFEPRPSKFFRRLIDDPFSWNDEYMSVDIKPWDKDWQTIYLLMLLYREQFGTWAGYNRLKRWIKTISEPSDKQEATIDKEMADVANTALENKKDELLDFAVRSSSLAKSSSDICKNVPAMPINKPNMISLKILSGNGAGKELKATFQEARIYEEWKDLDGKVEIREVEDIEEKWNEHESYSSDSSSGNVG